MRSVLLLFIALISGVANAEDLQSARGKFQQGNEAYASGEFVKALEIYKTISEDYHTFAYHYNLGNIYYKMDSVPQSILHYERAYQIKPNDENLRMNIELSNQKVIDKIEALPTLGVKDFWTNITARDNLGMWTNSSILLFSLCFAMLIVMLFSKTAIVKRTLILGAIFSFLGFVICYSMSRTIESFKDNRNAIIFVPKVDIKSNPGTDGLDVFILHEGTKVNIRQEEGDWYEVKIANGNVGWLPKSAVVII
jgi:tetratricopeptide (TPR) repeat protein